MKTKTLASLYFFIVAYIAFQVLQFPVFENINFYNLYAKLIATTTLLFLLINMHKIKHNTLIQKYLFSAFFFLFVSMMTNTLNEIFSQPWGFTLLLVDIGQVAGYILLFHGITTWIAQNSDQTGELKIRSETDELTRLYTRRHFNDALHNAMFVDQIKRTSSSLLIIN
ncbi:hypothetical protein N8878_08145, partial [Psychromonas sp.]|nr:hypothetical protein [Psychromonas sp.]